VKTPSKKITRVFEKNGETWKIVWTKQPDGLNRIIAFSSEEPVESLLQQRWDSEREIRDHVLPKYEAFIAAKVRQGFRLVSEETAPRVTERKKKAAARKPVRGVATDPDRVEMQFGRFSRKRSPHRAGAPIREVFVGNTKKLARMFTPLLAVDLSRIDPRWRGMVHFLDHNPNVGDRPLELAIETGGALAFEDEIEEIDEPTPPRRGFVHFVAVKLPRVPKSVLTSKKSWLDLGDAWVDDLRARMDDETSDLMMGCALGGFPRWVQRDATPRCCSSLNYIGQVSASELGGYDQHLYLFYCPKHRAQIQIAQGT
jgi:hypothetical protein